MADRDIAGVALQIDYAIINYKKVAGVVLMYEYGPEETPKESSTEEKDSNLLTLLEF